MKKFVKENLKPVVFVVVVLVLTAISAYPQRKFGGRVVEVIDGKTCVVEVPGGKLTFVLQYIEIPDPEQPLHQTVKGHLQSLVLDKRVEFLPSGVMKDKTIGRLFVKGVDVSQQMLRDGAAWYSVAEKSGQDEDESLLYQDNETQAKNEKRGVWGVENLKPVWEFRAEKAVLQRKQEEEAAKSSAFVSEMQNQQRQQQKPTVQPTRQLDRESGLWADNDEVKLPKGIMNVGGLLVAHDPSGLIGFVGTPPLKFEVLGNDNAPEMVIGIIYMYADDGPRGMKRFYIITVESESDDYNFLTNNNLVVTADKQKINFGKAKRGSLKYDYGVKEVLTYEIKRQTIEKIANSRDIQIRVGKYDGKSPAGIQDLLKNMLKATE